MTFKIIKAMVLVGAGADKIMLQTDLPCSTWPYEGFQTLNTEASAGYGEAYVKQHFGVDPEVVRLSIFKLSN